jgi:hypothetical protein
LLPIAQTADPDALSDTITQLRDTLDPDAADEAYLRALEQRDITLTPVGDLYQLRGVLDPVTGQSLKTMLYGMSKPDSKDDDRTAGQRRVDGLRQLCAQRLRHGVPTDHGHRPQLFVTVTRPRLARATGLADRAIAGTPTRSCDDLAAANGDRSGAHAAPISRRCCTATAPSATCCSPNWRVTPTTPRSPPPAAPAIPMTGATRTTVRTQVAGPTPAQAPIPAQALPKTDTLHKTAAPPGPPGPLDNVDPHRLHDELKRHRQRRNRTDRHHLWLYRRRSLPGPYDRSAGKRDNDSDDETDTFPQRE